MVISEIGCGAWISAVTTWPLTSMRSPVPAVAVVVRTGFGIVARSVIVSVEFDTTGDT